MKKIFLTTTFIFLSILTFSCPICGCGGTNTYFGLFPNFRNGFMGVRYNYAHYHTRLFSDPAQFSINDYNTMELWGGANIGRRWQVMAFIPYYLNKQTDDDGTSTKNGIGDVTIIGQYKVFTKTSLSNNHAMVQQQLWLGGGVKLATGTFNPDVVNNDITVADVNAQLGTGSTDFILTSMYNIKINDFGFNASANYKINASNNEGYKFGNKFSSNLIAFYQVNLNKKIIVPNAGIGYENVGKNSMQKAGVPFTKSSLATALAGVEISFPRLSIGLNAQMPLKQNFADGQTKMSIKAMAHVTFTL